MKPVPRRSLQIKLFVSFAVIILLTTALGYVFVANAINNSFEHYLDRSAENQVYQYARFIAGDVGSGEANIEIEDYAVGPGFDIENYDLSIRVQSGAHEIIHNIPPEELPNSFAFIELLNLPIAITNDDGEILFGPDRALEGKRISHVNVVRDQTLVIKSDDTSEERFMVPLSGTAWRSPLEENFIRSIPGALLPAGLIVGGIALLLSFGIVGQTIAPLRKLDAATRKVAEGNFAERVDVKGDDEVGHLALSFNNMAASLERSEKSKRNMIADVYHELRTPISIVQSGLEGLIDGVIEPTPENLSALHDRTQLVGRLVNDLQQLALADAGQLSIESSPCDLGELFTHIETAIGAELEEREIEFVTNFGLQDGLIEADVQRIEQVILNLLSNAERHTPDGGRIELSAHRNSNDQIEISVCDSGPGIPESELESIFERFYRADKSRARASGGSGLGLTIAKVLVEAHGGRIWAENAQTGGACVKFVLNQP